MTINSCSAIRQNLSPVSTNSSCLENKHLNKLTSHGNWQGQCRDIGSSQDTNNPLFLFYPLPQIANLIDCFPNINLVSFCWNFKKKFFLRHSKSSMGLKKESKLNTSAHQWFLMTLPLGYPSQCMAKWQHAISLFISCQSTWFKARAKGFTEAASFSSLSHPCPPALTLTFPSVLHFSPFHSLCFSLQTKWVCLKVYELSTHLFVMLSLGAHMALNLTSYISLLKCHFLWLHH